MSVFVEERKTNLNPALSVALVSGVPKLQSFTEIYQNLRDVQGGGETLPYIPPWNQEDCDITAGQFNAAFDFVLSLLDDEDALDINNNVIGAEDCNIVDENNNEPTDEPDVTANDVIEADNGIRNEIVDPGWPSLGI